jgi:hypothetical protein
MTRLDPVRGLVSAIAGLLIFSVLLFVAIVLSEFIFGWMDKMPTDNVWFWVYTLFCAALSAALAAFVSRLSYRGLSKIGPKPK